MHKYDIIHRDIKPENIFIFGVISMLNIENYKTWRLWMLCILWHYEKNCYWDFVIYEPRITKIRKI